MTVFNYAGLLNSGIGLLLAVSVAAIAFLTVMPMGNQLSRYRMIRALDRQLIAICQQPLAGLRPQFERDTRELLRQLASTPGLAPAHNAAALHTALTIQELGRSVLALAQLDLARSTVRAPVNGYVTNLLLRPGDYAAVGVPKMALVDADSFWVYGYFEETRLRHVRVGDAAEVTLLGRQAVLHGEVASIAYAIADRDNPVAADLTANVNPVFNWVRLASRIPVRISLKNVPADVHLAAGMTCTVVIKAPHSGL
jgi:multidrug resistance efflux pump